MGQARIRKLAGDYPAKHQDRQGHAVIQADWMYHYTPSYRAAMILNDGALRPSKKHSFPGAESLVWVTTSTTIDPTVTVHSKGIAAITGEHFYVRFGFPLARSVPYAVLPIEPAVRARMQRTSKGAHHLWRAIEGPVDIAGATIEWNRGGTWKPADMDMLRGFLDKLGGAQLMLA